MQSWMKNLLNCIIYLQDGNLDDFLDIGKKEINHEHMNTVIKQNKHASLRTESKCGEML